ncbi:MAG: hypothetical protein ACLT98_11530 [Eggerthellaceae bacterium]
MGAHVLAFSGDALRRMRIGAKRLLPRGGAAYRGLDRRGCVDDRGARRLRSRCDRGLKAHAAYAEGFRPDGIPGGVPYRAGDTMKACKVS